MQRISAQLLVNHARTRTPQYKQASTRHQPRWVTNDSKQAQTGHRSARIVYILATSNPPSRKCTKKAHNGRRAHRCLPAAHQPVLTFMLPVGTLGTSSTPGPSQLANRIETHDGILAKSCRLPAHFVLPVATLDTSIPRHASNTTSLIG